MAGLAITPLRQITYVFECTFRVTSLRFCDVESALQLWVVALWGGELELYSLFEERCFCWSFRR